MEDHLNCIHHLRIKFSIIKLFVKPMSVCLFVLFILIGVLTKVFIFALFGLIPLIPMLIYHYQIRMLKKESMLKEW